ncbi:MAG: hypothetical protein JOZ80_10395 [Acidobacteriaceae bacterium]|nr:hypothetical protein [Acidobacteriaceae bacterium]
MPVKPICCANLQIIEFGMVNAKLWLRRKGLAEEIFMLKSLLVIILCAATLPAFCEPSAKYEVATILDVKPHQLAGDNSSSAAATYDVSLKVAGTIYQVLYTDTLGTTTVRYIAGREVLVHVGENSITYNDISGRSQEVPIISQKPAKTISASK